ncbi:hypothetical protein ACKWRH_06745 [Bradyrhizobium sp. Pa8]|uniref:hypothetical protein n=1 Tax=Bradyrhizobium sp. Pa8 TaxID=3386552 RepID=UPI00403F24D1
MILLPSAMSLFRTLFSVGPHLIRRVVRIPEERNAPQLRQGSHEGDVSAGPRWTMLIEPFEKGIDRRPLTGEGGANSTPLLLDASSRSILLKSVENWRLSAGFGLVCAINCTNRD